MIPGSDGTVKMKVKAQGMDVSPFEVAFMWMFGEGNSITLEGI